MCMLITLFTFAANYIYMRKITLILSLFIFSFLPLVTSAQTVGNLWGMTTVAGDSGGGVLFCYNPLTQNDSINIPFSTPDGYNPYGDLVQGSDGSFYGMTSLGGAYFYGELFKWSPSGGMKIIHSFGGITSDGRSPYGKVIIGNDGMLYGMTYSGGLNNDGVIFQCSTDGKTYNLLHTFSTNPTDGYNPYGSLVQGGNGMLYGMTYNGGLQGNGVIFKCSTNGLTFDTIHSFGVLSYDGQYPYGSLIIGKKDGMLYGMTNNGGPNGQGVIFKCDTINGIVYDTVHTFGILSNDNGYPEGDLVQAKNGTLYGLTYSGGLSNRGMIFKCSTNGAIYDSLHSFNVVSGDGRNPYGRLIFGADSSLYGLAYGGGLYSDGSIFKCDTTGTVYDTLYSFGSGKDGYYPYGSLVMGKDGNLYGMTEGGGSLNNGIIFSFNLTSDKENVAYNFGANVLGNSPSGKPIQGKDGNFYGMTSAGGQYGKGTIFKYTPSTGAMVVLHVFSGDTNDGGLPYGSLVMAHNGIFYGMTYKGGSYGYGSLFKVTPAGKFTLIHSFSYSSNDGGFPRGSLIFGHDGYLYGMSLYGGSSGSRGVIFNCDTLGNLTGMHSFSGSDGLYPSGDLIQSDNGTLYGMASSGGASNYGTIFKCTTAGTFNLLHSFTSNPDGAYPSGAPIFGSDSNLYALSYNGGANSNGSYFKCDTNNGSTESVLHSFLGSSTDGQHPNGGLLAASDGKFYGMTYYGGTKNFGSLFSADMAGTVTMEYSFTSSSDGSLPVGELTEMMSTSASSAPAGCSGTAASFSVRGAMAPLTYTWSNGSTSAIDTIKMAGTYTLSVTDSRGITVSTTVNISNSVVSVTAGNTSICKGSSTNLSASGAGGTPTLTYGWMPGSLSGTTPSVNPATTTTYTVTVTDGSGCKDSTTEKVTVNSLPVVSITGKDTILQGANDTLTATGGISYSWSGGGTSNPDIVSPASTQTYTVTVTNAQGCVNTDTIRVVVDITTGINSASVTNSTIAYPNPVANTLNLDFKVDATTEGKIEVCDVTGKAIVSSEQTISNGQAMHIDVSSLAPGLYFVKVVTGKQTQVIRFIKQ
jgi:uncharacterized repeat protein (TIGR03803 family)